MAFPISPQTILEFKLFKEELHTLLDNVLDQAETLQTTAEEPVVLDRDWIIGKLKDRITTEKSTVVCDPFCGGMDASQVVRALDNLTGFERVILELDLEWWGEPWPDTIDETQEYRIWARINGAVHHQKKLLEPTLGTGSYSFDEKGLRLAFHPRK